MKKIIRLLIFIMAFLFGVFTFSSLKTKALGFTTSGFAWSISTQFGEDAARSTGIHWLSEQTNT